MGCRTYLSVTSRPLTSLQKEAVLSPCNFVTTHLAAYILNFSPLIALQPMNSQRPKSRAKKEPQRQRIARTAPNNFLNVSRALPSKTRVFRQIAQESSPESSDGSPEIRKMPRDASPPKTTHPKLTVYANSLSKLFSACLLFNLKERGRAVYTNSSENCLPKLLSLGCVFLGRASFP